MDIRIMPYSAEAEHAAQAFNARLRAGGELEFQLPNRLPADAAPGSAIRNANYLAMEGDVVRGGFLLASFPGSFGTGEETEVINCREPLSEGIIDPKYSLLALRLLKQMQQHGPLMFALGMGSEQARFTRLLKGAGWTIEPVPFFFRVVNVGTFLRESRPLQEGKLKIAARFAGPTGAGKLGITALQRRGVSAALRARSLTIERISEWGSWADELWDSFRWGCSFAVKRDRATLRELYNLGSDRSIGFVVRRGKYPVGWIAAQNSRFSNHKYFGAMQVATILDCAARPELRAAVLSCACRQLAKDGADLIVSNQSHRAWLEAFRSAGFLNAKSNYILATSKELSARIAQQTDGRLRMHFTRGDGDGRDHL